ncbi:MAG: signal peptide peptidase SppA [Caldilineaceae bacterium]|nr:signal peptide peptidase SppA [Caldilineaceae bacterium]
MQAADTQQQTPPRKESQESPVRSFLHGLAAFGEQLGCLLANARRALFRGRMADYAVIRMDREVSERMPHIPWFYAYLPNYKPPLSLESLHNALQRIADDPDVHGVIFLMKGPALSLSQAQSMAALFARFRRWDQQHRRLGVPAKQIVVHLEQVSAPAYLVAAAADRVTMPPLTSWDVMGLRIAPTYWKETLTRVGVAFDVIKVAPWKTAADSFIRSDMSEAERDQYNWLLDSLSDDIVSAISQGRNLSTEQVRALIDQAPLTAEQALAAGLVDQIAYEDQLPELLKPGTHANQKTDDKPAALKPYAQLHGLLYRRPRPQRSGQIGVISVHGTIIVGESRSFPLPLPIVGDDMMGSETVLQQLRAARQDQRLAAVVLHVDSGGGSALASDLMWRELKLLDQEKPLIVYMGNVAASGGYYIAAPGRKIVAQSATLTGSIGVVIAKPVTSELRAKIGANREVIRRGDNAGVYTDDQHWTAEQRRKMEEQLFSVYDTFKQRVAEGRSLPFEAIDDIANGRVWTGKQALAHGLVDQLGDFEDAFLAACRAANLPDDGSVRSHLITRPPSHLLAEPAKATQAAWQQVNGHGFSAWATALIQGEWLRLLTRDPIWLIPPDLPRIE